MTVPNRWTVRDHALERTFRFRNFIDTFAFMSQIALLAERANHHPDWSGGYNHLTVRLTTHDAGGITERDHELAEQISALARHQ